MTSLASPKQGLWRQHMASELSLVLGSTGRGEGRQATPDVGMNGSSLAGFRNCINFTRHTDIAMDKNHHGFFSSN